MPSRAGLSSSLRALSSCEDAHADSCAAVAAGHLSLSDAGPSQEDPQPTKGHAFIPSVVRYGVAEAMNRRRAMEDAHVALGELPCTRGQDSPACRPPHPSAMFAVFDGHNGAQAAQFAGERIAPYFLSSTGYPDDLEAALLEAFLRIDHDYYAATLRSGDSAGTTALAAVLWGSRLVIANAGDSRAVLSRHGRAIDLTRDHKPHVPRERDRIEATGGFVCGEGLLCGELGVARAIGDYHVHPDLKSRPSSPSARSDAWPAAAAAGVRRGGGRHSVRPGGGCGSGGGSTPSAGGGATPVRTPTASAPPSPFAAPDAGAGVEGLAALDLDGELAPLPGEGEGDDGGEPPAPLPLMPGLSLTGGPLTAEPETLSHVLAATDEFLVLGCDGLWDVFPSQRAVEFCRARLREHNCPERCAQELVAEAIRMHSSDNITAIVVCFSPDPPPRRVYTATALAPRGAFRAFRAASIDASALSASKAP